MSQDQNKVGRLTLRKKQQEFVETILANGKGTYLLSVPGGYGKTDAVLAAYKLLREAGEVDRFLYICWGTMRSQEFFDTLKDKLERLEFEKRTTYLQVNVEGAVTLKESRQNLYEFYLVNTEKLIYRYPLAELTKENKWFIVIDESHHATETNRGGLAIDNLQFTYRVGLSATPLNQSGQSLINENTVPQENITSMTDGEAIKEKAIRRFNYEVANYDIELIDKDKVIKKLTTDELREWEDKFDTQKELRMSDRYVKEIFMKAFEYYNKWNFRSPGQHRILVFAPNVMSAKYACSIINNIEGDGFADWIGSGVSERSTEQNIKIKKDFQDGGLQCLVQVAMASEGFDAPKASIGIWLSFFYNSNQAAQMCYRIRRRNYEIKEYSNDKCIMLVPSDSNAVELFESIKTQQEIDFPERPSSESKGADAWPSSEAMVEIIDAKIREWRGEAFDEKKIDEIIEEGRKRGFNNVDTPEYRAEQIECIEQWYLNRNKKVKEELTKEEYRKILDRQVKTFAVSCMKIIYNGYGVPSSEIGSYIKKINSQLLRRFMKRDLATIEDLKNQCSWMTEEYNRLKDNNNIPLWL